MLEEGPLVEVENLRKVFHGRGEKGRRRDFVAVDGVSFSLPAGASLGIVGESGSGKTTTARILAGLEKATSGSVRICGRDRAGRRGRGKQRLMAARDLQIVFQDPYLSLDPHQRVGECIMEVLKLHFKMRSQERRDRAVALLDQVGLDESRASARPRVLSGGERQRVAIARALAAQPRIVILDEAVSALDMSIQAQVLNRLADIREETGTSYIVISHDLAVVRFLTDQAIVMQRGVVVEEGSTAQILDEPLHQYTQLLRDSIPRPHWKPQRRSLAVAVTDGGASESP